MAAATTVEFKQQFLTLARSGPAADFTAMVSSLSGRRSKGNLSLPELMAVLSAAETEQMWTSLIQRRWFATAMSAIEGTPAEQLFEELESLADDPHVTASRPEAAAALTAIATCLQQFLLARKPASVSEDCLALACNLHDVVFELSAGATSGDAADAAAQKAIVRMCEVWCLERVEGFENLVARFVPVLLFAALGEDARAVDVRRLYALRDVLSVFDIDDPSSESLRSQLLNCFISPRFLEDKKVGLKFLAHVFQLSRSMMADVHTAVKNQIPFTKAKPLLVCYGQLYFAVWEAANARGNAAVRDHFESTCLQDLFHRAVHARPEVFKNLLRVLAPIHEHKRDSTGSSSSSSGGGGVADVKAVDSMLLRLYAPFLWRSMKVANATVRRNAVVLLADLFPLQEPSLTAHAEIEELATRQHAALAAALMDPAPAVRVVAVEGACRVLGTFWEIVPEAFKKQFLSTFVRELVFDQASAAVRAAVFEGLAFVLDNRLCHAAMKRVLPTLAACIHDRSERVRGKFLDLLLRVKCIRDIQFFDVVPVDDLLARLAADAAKPALAKKLTSLLLNSYFPSSGSGGRSKKDGSGGAVRERLARAKVLMEQNPAAAVAFYSNLRQHVALPEVCSLLDALNKCMVAILSAMAPRAKGRAAGSGGGGASRKRSLGGEDDEDDDAVVVAEDDDDDDDAAVLKGHATKVLLLLHVVTGTWESVAKDLTKRGGAKAAAYLRATLGGNFCDTARSGLAPFFPPGVVEALLCRLAALLDAEDCSGFRAGVIPKLVELGAGTAGPAPEAAYAPLVELCCQWGMEGDVLDLALGSLDAAATAAANEEDPAAVAGARRPKKRSAAAAKKAKAKAAGGSGGATVPAAFAARLLLLVLTKNFSGARDRVLESAATMERLQQCFARVVPEAARRVEAAAAASSPAPAPEVLASSTLTDEALVDVALCAFKLQIHREVHRNHTYGPSEDGGASASGFCAMLDDIVRTLLPCAALFSAPTTTSASAAGGGGVDDDDDRPDKSPARQRRRRKERGGAPHTPARLAKATNPRPGQGAALQLLWSVAAVAAATAHDYLALELDYADAATTSVLRFFADATQAVADFTSGASRALATAFAVEAGAVYRHAAAALAIVADPAVSRVESLADWRGEQASLAERAFAGVLRIDAAAAVPRSQHLVAGFVAKFALRQPALVQAFVPLLVAAVLDSSGSNGSSESGSGCSAQSRNAAAQRATIAGVVVEQAARDPVAFRATCDALVAAVERPAAGTAAVAATNAACRLLTKVVAQGCRPGGTAAAADDGDDEEGAADGSGDAPRRFTPSEEGEVRAAVEGVQRWVGGATAAPHVTGSGADAATAAADDDDDENAAPSNRRAPPTGAGAAAKQATTAAGRLAAHLGGRVTMDAAARLCGAVTAAAQSV